jgi:TPR repeat protein
MGNLGVYCMNGLGGTRKDPRAAVALFKDGAAKNNAACMYFYARCLYDGVGGLTANHAEAVSYYRAAAERGFAPARDWCRQNAVSFAGE